MLEMNCPRCNGLIKSPLLIELKTVDCSQCHENVEVKNVVVATKNFSMQRNDLTSRISHYKKLLRDVEKEIKGHNTDENLKKNRPNSAENLRSSLKELLLAARDNFRLNMSYDLYVQINFDNHKRLARLLNISSTGAAIQLTGRGQVPEHNSQIKLELLLPGYAETLPLLARVVWSRKPANDTPSQSVEVGLQFISIDEETRACIWDFIVDSETSGQK